MNKEEKIIEPGKEKVLYNPILMADARAFGEAYTNSNLRKKRNIQAKRGLLLTKQGRKRTK